MHAKHPLDVVSRAAKLTDSVLVSHSGGKDSLAVLDLCWTRFKRVEIFWMYMIPGLDFQEQALRRTEKRYPGLVIHRVPHWALSGMFRTASMRAPTAVSLNCPSIKYKDVEAHVRKITGIDWVAIGAKMCDSLERRGMIARCNGVDEPRRRFYPLAAWNAGAVLRHLRRQRIHLPPDYALFGGSFDGWLGAEELAAIHQHYPADFERIAERFPHVRGEMLRHRMVGGPVKTGWGRGWDVDERAEKEPEAGAAREIPGFPGYRIDTDGQVYSAMTQAGGTVWRVGDEWRPLKALPNGKGYLRVWLSTEDGAKERRFVHHLVLEAFVGPRPGDDYEACHENDINTDNRLDNLRWDTKAANVADKVRNQRARKELA